MAHYTGSSASYSTATRQDIESYFAKVMSPIKKEADPNLVAQFCQRVNTDIEGPQIALDLITNKMQSQQEWECLVALYTIEACVKNCGERFHALVGRFRFLNELIKLLSPKYYGNRTSEKTKKKCIELLYSWSKGLKNEPKIAEAYEMLKRQGIVKEDPTYVDELVINVPPRLKNPTFEDPDKSRLLARLLQSKNPQDLEHANRLIKNMVRQDEIKTEKISNRINELEHIGNNMKILNDMLIHYNAKTSSTSEKDTMKLLYDSLKNLQPNLVKLANETDDNDDSIGDIIKSLDQCEHIIQQYKILVEQDPVAIAAAAQNKRNQAVASGSFASSAASSGQSLIDESLISVFSTPAEANNKSDVDADPLKELHDLFADTTIQSKHQQHHQPTTASLLDSSDFGVFTQPQQHLHQQVTMTPLTPLVSLKSKDTNNNQSQQQQAVALLVANKTPQLRALDDLNELGRTLMEKSISDPNTSLATAAAFASATPVAKPQFQKSLKEIQKEQLYQKSQQQQFNNNVLSTPTTTTAAAAADSALVSTLNELIVPLESIRPAASIPPLCVYDRNQVKCVLHVARDQPVSGIYVAVLSVTSTNESEPLTGFAFQAAVPKSMRIKLQTATRSDLPVFNPILPPCAITQVILIANPAPQEPIRLKCKLNYTFGDQAFNEVVDEVKHLQVPQQQQQQLIIGGISAVPLTPTQASSTSVNDLLS